jgi:hypothetical protein
MTKASQGASTKQTEIQQQCNITNRNVKAIYPTLIALTVSTAS